MSAYLCSQYASLGTFLENGKLAERTRPSLTELTRKFPELEPSDISNLLVKQIETYSRQIAGDQDDYIQIRGTIQQCVSRHIWDKVITQPDYPATISANDPNMLYQIIRRIATFNATGSSLLESQYLAKRIYNQIRMGPTVSIINYKSEFLMAISNLQHLGCEVPEEPEQARHFLMTLDPDRFSEFVRYTIQMERTNSFLESEASISSKKGSQITKITGSSFPKSVQAVVDQLQAFVLTPTKTVSKPAIYATVSKCHTCGKPGHYARDCKSGKAHPVSSSAAPVAAKADTNGAADDGKSAEPKPKPKPPKPRHVHVTDVDIFKACFGFMIKATTMATESD